MGEKKVITIERNVFGGSKKDKPKSFRISEKMDQALTLVSNYYGRKPSELITVVIDQFLQAQSDEVPGLDEIIQSEIKSSDV